MAPTGDERREVAARLRGYIVYARRHDLDGDYAKESDKCVDTRSTLYNDIASCIEEFGNFNLSAEQVFIRLADLMDPTCEVVPFDEESMRLPRCSRCGQPILKPWPSLCPNCGSRVTTGGDAE